MKPEGSVQTSQPNNSASKSSLLEKQERERWLRKKKKVEGYVEYPIGDWESFSDESKKHFLRRYYGRNMRKCEFRKGDFEVLYTVWCGETSRVMLTRWRDVRFVAVKVREKKEVVRRGTVAQTLREVRLLSFIRFPFIMSAVIVQCNLYLYYIMSFACGNSLDHLIQTRILSEGEAMFYSAQLVLALEFLHRIGVVHRKVEPSNVLICHDGYVKLSGFSKARVGPGLTPPDLLHSRHAHLYDLMSLGRTIYSLCSSESPTDLPLPTPHYFSPDLRLLISSLTDTTQCPPCTSHLRSHPWFSSLQWCHLENKRIRPPFLPQCSHPVRHFNTFPTLPLQVSSFDPYHLLFKDAFPNY